MKLDYIKIQKEAARMKISPYLLIKRKINYRLGKLTGADCRFCENLRYFTGGIQCEIIGLGYHKHAYIDHLYICDCFKRI
jgi:hypothetical protein